ncbi:hypothetical protein PAHAL_3G024200 [Panicum hallii]|jgi:hypothetical protein|uniref:RING-type domain-containing protein n=1 Tax=Panicum hallii TaxID=206008 RepID=A0A2S3H5Q6_9POAL|nr:E3 ubiquitin-protein ligase ATL42-like [Panicum hallii]PAN15827.2 hypothetical protein PAHAL_3G024200 [Panicum hallii]
MSSSPIDQLDAAAAASDGRVVTHHQPVFHGRTSSLQETRIERRPYDADAERSSRVITATLIYRPESSRSCKRARLAASSDAVLGLQEAGDGAGTPAAAECAVCLQDFAAEDKLRAMPCSHTFHQDCIFRWLLVNHVCPLCRHALPTQEQDDDEDERRRQEDAIDEIYREFYEVNDRYFGGQYLDPHYGDENHQQESMPPPPVPEEA